MALPAVTSCSETVLPDPIKLLSPLGRHLTPIRLAGRRQSMHTYPEDNKASEGEGLGASGGLDTVEAGVVVAGEGSSSPTGPPAQ